MRSKKLLYNSISGLALELIMILSGLILPRLIITSYGSATNGLLSSISQFLGIIALLRAGVGGVVRAALYKPLANRDNQGINAVVRASDQFMRKIALIFAGLTILIAAIYPLLVSDEYKWAYCFSLVLILGAGTFIQYYFGVTYQLLLIADQRQYIYSIIQGIAVLVNLLASVILIKLGLGIHFVKLASALAYSATPLFLRLYIKRNYELRRDVVPNKTAIAQRWDAMGHQLANYVRTSVPILVLTFFMPLREVSVYTVYVFVLQSGISTIINAVFSNTDAAFGNMVARNETHSLNKNFQIIEFVLSHTCALLFSCAYVLMPGFIVVYTSGVTDVDYQRPVLLMVFTISELLYSLRTPYYSLINATGQYKQTRNAAIIESVCNVGLSVLLVPYLGLVGAAIASVIAMAFRTGQLMLYTSKVILHRDLFPLAKTVGTCAFCLFVSVFITKYMVVTVPDGYLSWEANAVFVFIISAVINLLVAVVLNRRLLFDCLTVVKRLIKKTNS